MENIIKYNSKTFSEIKEELIGYIKETYPDVLSDFTDSSVGSMLIDLNAGVSNQLTLTTERVFQETQLEYAQLKSSLINIAKNMGLKLPNKRPSMTMVDFTIDVGVAGSGPNMEHLKALTLAKGAQVVGGGVIFETINNIKWDGPYGDGWVVDPIRDSNNNIIGYEITRRAVVYNGVTNIYKRVIQPEDVIPFFSITLPGDDIIEIDEVVLADPSVDETIVFNLNDSDLVTKFYEVDYLAQQRVFMDKIEDIPNNVDGIVRGHWYRTTKKYIKEYDENGICKIIFGSGGKDIENAFQSGGLLENGGVDEYFLDTFLNNTALGEKLEFGKVLYVKYRSGGGSNTNVGKGVITSMGNFNLDGGGLAGNIIGDIRRSLRVTNPFPAVGGNDGLNIEQIRHLIKYNFSSQQRAINIRDYQTEIYKMPSKYGSPFRVSVVEENNKIVVSVLGIDANGKLIKLNNPANQVVKKNIEDYLSGIRSINDYVEIRDGKIINLKFEIYIQTEKVNESLVGVDVINVVIDFLDIKRNEMNQNIYIGKLEKKILEVNGVINVIGIDAYNKTGKTYSSDLLDVESDKDDGYFEIINNTIYCPKSSMFEIKYPKSDIVVHVIS